MRKIVMLGSQPRTQRSLSSVQLPAEYTTTTSSVPIYQYRTDDFIIDLREFEKKKAEEYETEASSSDSPEKTEKQSLKDLIHARWEAAKAKNAFNYGLNCMYKCLDGKYNLSIQLNVERGELRRKPMRFKHIREPFNHLRWNFTKLNETEVMMYLRCDDDPISDDLLDRHLVAVNASPLERDHCLIVPSVNKRLPQVLTPTAIRLATDMMLLVDDDSFHILFNSLLGQASVNHLHLHCLYWPYESDLIHRRFEPLRDDIFDVYTIRPPFWMCSAFAFQLPNRESYEKFKKNLTDCVEYLTSQEQAHNVFFTRAQPIRTDGKEHDEDRKRERQLLVTAYVFPRVNMIGAKPPTNFNPAANELAGCLTSYTFRFFDSVSEQAAVRIVEEEAQLEDEIFQNLSYDLCDVLTQKPLGTSKPSAANLFENLTSPEMDEMRDSFQTFGPISPNIPKRRHRTHSEGTINAPLVKFTFAE